MSFPPDALKWLVIGDVRLHVLFGKDQPVVDEIDRNSMIIAANAHYTLQLEGGAVLMRQFVQSAIDNNVPSGQPESAKILGYSVNEIRAFKEKAKASGATYWDVKYSPEPRRPDSKLRLNEPAACDAIGVTFSNLPDVPAGVWSGDRIELDGLVCDDLGVAFRYLPVLKADSHASHSTTTKDAERGWPNTLHTILETFNQVTQEGGERLPWIIGTFDTSLPQFEYEDGFWSRLSEYPQLLDRTVLVVSVEALREAGARISTSISWEQTFSEVLAALSSGDDRICALNRFAYIIIRFGIAGAILIAKSVQGIARKLFFSPEHTELSNTELGKTDGYVLGFTSVYVANLVKIILANGNGHLRLEKIAAAVTDSIAGCQILHSRGYGEMKQDVLKVNNNLSEGTKHLFQDEEIHRHLTTHRIVAVDISRAAGPGLSILQEAAANATDSLARNIVLFGVTSVINQPQCSVNQLLMVVISQFVKQTCVLLEKVATDAQDVCKQEFERLRSSIEDFQNVAKDIGNNAVKGAGATSEEEQKERNALIKRLTKIVDPILQIQFDSMKEEIQDLTDGYPAKKVIEECLQSLGKLDAAREPLPNLRNKCQQLLLQFNSTVDAYLYSTQDLLEKQVSRILYDDKSRQDLFSHAWRDIFDEFDPRQLGSPDNVKRKWFYESVRNLVGTRPFVLWEHVVRQAIAERFKRSVLTPPSKSLAMSVRRKEDIPKLIELFKIVKDVDSPHKIQPHLQSVRSLDFREEIWRPSAKLVTAFMEIPAPVAYFGRKSKESLGRDERILLVDRREIEGCRAVRNLIRGHLDLFKTNKRSRSGLKPLSIGVFGPPGAGKSTVVRGIIRERDDADVEILSYNLAQFVDTKALDDAFDDIVGAMAKHKIPVVFFDEFDAKFGEQELGWLKFFLPALEDGKFKKHSVGDSIFVFAGGTCSSFAEFSREQKHGTTDPEMIKFSLAKGPDFVSRLKGHLNILGINPISNEVDDELYLIRRAVLMRHFLEERQNLNTTDVLAKIDPDLLRALLHVPKYRHGGRSLRMMIELCLDSDDELRKSSIPPLEQIHMHVDGKAFEDLLRRLN